MSLNQLQSPLNTRYSANFKIPVLTFHSIDESGSVISTRPEVFRQQMNFLYREGFEVVTLKTLTEKMKLNRLSTNMIVLTFDDGFENFHTTAFPILNEFNFSATVFLITDYCGRYNDWKGNPSNLKPQKLMNWQAVKELNNQGIEFGAHSLTHRDLTAISHERATREIIESKHSIEEKLGIEVTNFAYPYGRFNSSVKQIVQETYQAACSTRLGKVQSSADLHTLKRLDAYYLSDTRIFHSISTNGFDLYIRFRQLMRDLKKLW